MIMEKIIFVNVSDLDTLNYDSDDLSWKNSPRLSGLNKTNEKLNVCLYGLNGQSLSPEQIIALLKFSDNTDFHTISNGLNMETGFYPLVLDQENLYFTDKAEYSLLNGDWAFDCVYKIPSNINGVTFSKYSIELPNGWQQCVVDNHNIRIKDLFGIVKDKLSVIDEFCNNNRNSNVTITYIDKYVKTELAMIICLQFIKDLITSLQPRSYKVCIKGEVFSEYNANNEKYRRIGDCLSNDRIRDEVGETLIDDERYSFVSENKNSLPHYRELKIEAGNNTLIIMPDAGLAHWGLDVEQCRRDRTYYEPGKGVNKGIPICSSSDQVFYAK